MDSKWVIFFRYHNNFQQHFRCVTSWIHVFWSLFWELFKYFFPRELRILNSLPMIWEDLSRKEVNVVFPWILFSRVQITPTQRPLKSDWHHKCLKDFMAHVSSAALSDIQNNVPFSQINTLVFWERQQDCLKHWCEFL